MLEAHVKGATHERRAPHQPHLAASTVAGPTTTVSPTTHPTAAATRAPRSRSRRLSSFRASATLDDPAAFSRSSPGLDPARARRTRRRASRGSERGCGVVPLGFSDNRQGLFIPNQDLFHALNVVRPPPELSAPLDEFWVGAKDKQRPFLRFEQVAHPPPYSSSTSRSCLSPLPQRFLSRSKS